MPTKSITLKETRFVPMEAAKAVRLVADFDRISEWDPSIEKSTRTDDSGDAPLSEGATFDLVLRFMGVQSEMSYKLVSLETHRAQLDGEGGNISAVDVVEAVDRPEKGGADVTWTATLTFRGAQALALPLLRPALNKLGVNAVDGLQRWLTKMSEAKAAA